MLLVQRNFQIRLFLPCPSLPLAIRLSVRPRSIDNQRNNYLYENSPSSHPTPRDDATLGCLLLNLGYGNNTFHWSSLSLTHSLRASLWSPSPNRLFQWNRKIFSVSLSVLLYTNSLDLSRIVYLQLVVVLLCCITVNPFLNLHMHEWLFIFPFFVIGFIS